MQCSQPSSCFGAHTTTGGHHRNPFFDNHLGLVPERLIVDALHFLFLGVAQRQCGHVIHLLMEHDAWQVGDVTRDACAEVSVVRLPTSSPLGLQPASELATLCTGWSTSHRPCSRTVPAQRRARNPDALPDGVMLSNAGSGTGQRDRLRHLWHHRGGHGTPTEVNMYDGQEQVWKRDGSFGIGPCIVFAVVVPRSSVPSDIPVSSVSLMPL